MPSDQGSKVTPRSLAHARVYETKTRAGTVLTFEFPVVIARGEEVCGVVINGYVPPICKGLDSSLYG